MSGGGTEYSLIFLSHVLEHIVDPISFVRQCAEVNPRYFFIEVPTFDAKFVNEPYGMFAEEHVNCFTLESMEQLMAKCGYRLIDAEVLMGIGIRIPAGSPSVQTLWEKCCDAKPHVYVNSVEDILRSYMRTSEQELSRIKNIIDTIKTDKLAVWGTGHHVSMLLANTALGDIPIVKFYDSDPQKQSIPMAGRPVQAFNPHDVESGEIDTILVATYVAQESICRVLADYNVKCKIVTLY